MKKKRSTSWKSHRASFRGCQADRTYFSLSSRSERRIDQPQEWTTLQLNGGNNAFASAVAKRRHAGPLRQSSSLRTSTWTQTAHRLAPSTSSSSSYRSGSTAEASQPKSQRVQRQLSRGQLAASLWLLAPAVTPHPTLKRCDETPPDPWHWSRGRV